MVGIWTLNPSILVRIQVRQHVDFVSAKHVTKSRVPPSAGPQGQRGIKANREAKTKTSILMKVAIPRFLKIQEMFQEGVL